MRELFITLWLFGGLVVVPVMFAYWLKCRKAFWAARKAEEELMREIVRELAERK